MKKAPCILLILFGAFWLLWATAIPLMMRMRAMSDAGQLQANLHTWARRKVQDQKLTEADLQEIFTEDRVLRMGGENPNANFNEMIQKIAQSSAPPWWAGAAALVMGATALARVAQNEGKTVAAKPEDHD